MLFDTRFLSSGGRRSLGRLVQHIAKVGEVAADLLVKVQLADVVLVAGGGEPAGLYPRL